MAAAAADFLNREYATPLVTVAAVGMWLLGLYLGSFLLSVIGAYYCFPVHVACHGTAAAWVGHVSLIPLLVPYSEFTYFNNSLFRYE